MNNICACRKKCMFYGRGSLFFYLGNTINQPKHYDKVLRAVFTNTSQTLPDIRSGAVLNFTRPNKILQDRRKSNNLKQYLYGAGTIWAQFKFNLIPDFSHI